MITLEAISPAEYKTWLTQAIRDYAEDKVSSGNWDASEALDRSGAEFHRLLPDGPATPDNFIFSLMAPNASTKAGEEAAPVSVGVLWFALPRRLWTNQARVLRVSLLGHSREWRQWLLSRAPRCVR